MRSIKSQRVWRAYTAETICYHPHLPSHLFSPLALYQAVRGEAEEIRAAAETEAPRDVTAYPAVQRVQTEAVRFVPLLQQQLLTWQAEDTVSPHQTVTRSACVSWGARDNLVKGQLLWFNQILASLMKRMRCAEPKFHIEPVIGSNSSCIKSKTSCSKAKIRLS